MHYRNHFTQYILYFTVLKDALEQKLSMLLALVWFWGKKIGEKKKKKCSCILLPGIIFAFFLLLREENLIHKYKLFLLFIKFP